MEKKSFIVVILVILAFSLFSGCSNFSTQSTFTDSNDESTNLPVTNHPSTSGSEDPPKVTYDVIVVGGEPDGVAAAIAAARNGAKTLLIEQRDGLGGLMTYGMLNFIDLAYDVKGQIVNAGIFKEWHQMVGNKTSFDIDVGKKAFMDLVTNEPNLTLSLETKVKRVIKEDNRLIGIIVEDNTGTKSYYGKRFIDSTPDADLAVMAGVPYFIGNKDIGIERKMAVTLMMHFNNVDWEGVREAVKSKKFGWANMNSVAAWGFGDLHYSYKPVEPNTRLRGLNIARQDDGSVVINALQIFEVNPLDKSSYQEGVERGKRETLNILKFLKDEFPGFENAEIASYPDELYVRETRHIYSEYQLPISDLWENKDQDDSIGFGGYPVDVQATSVNDYGYVITNPKQYSIPFRSLIPKNVDGLLVSGRSSGYSSLAAGSTRIIPTTMTTGEAAGVASVISINYDIPFREMPNQQEIIKTLRSDLEKEGALLYHYNLSYPYKDEWYYPSIKILLNHGLVSAGYNNDLGVDKTIDDLKFLYFFSKSIQVSNNERYQELKDKLSIQIYQASEIPLTRDQIAFYLSTIFDIQQENGESLWDTIHNEQIIDDFIYERVTTNRNLLRKEIYYITSHIIEKVETNSL